MPYSDPAQQLSYQNDWMKRRRIEWCNSNGPCVDCDTWENLTVDHEDASQKVSHRIWSWSKERRDRELAKCVVRCWPCHMKKSANERAKGSQHGNSVLTEEVVLSIRERVANGESQIDLARELNVHKDTISCIIRRKTWNHI